jgi:hypothetical protein
MLPGIQARTNRITAGQRLISWSAADDAIGHYLWFSAFTGPCRYP